MANAPLRPDAPLNVGHQRLPAVASEPKQVAWLIGQSAADVLFGLFSGILLALAFPPWNFPSLAWLALVPMGYSAIASRSSWCIASSYLGGLAFYGSGLFFIATARTSPVQLGPYWLLWCGIAGMAALTWPCAIIMLRFLVRRLRWNCTCALALTWVAAEWLRQAMFYPLDGNGLPFLSLAHSQVDAWLIPQVADLGGESLISFLVAMINGLAIDALTVRRRSQKSRRALYRMGGICALLIGAAGIYGLARESYAAQPGPRVFLAPKAMTQADDWRDLSALVPPNAELIVLPEMSSRHVVAEPDLFLPGTVAAVSLDANERLRLEADVSFLPERARALKQPVVVGCYHATRNANGLMFYNAAAIFDPERGLVGIYDKRHLAVGGDFLPHWLEASGVVPTEFEMGYPNQAQTATGGEARGFARGSEYPTFTLNSAKGRITVACAVCYDTAFSNSFRSYFKTQPAPELLVVCGHEATDRSGVGSQALLTSARFRAIECRRPLVRCVSGGTTCSISSLGYIVSAEPTSPLPETLLITALLDDRFSVYCRWGDAPLMTLFAVAVGVTILCRRRDAASDS